MCHNTPHRLCRDTSGDHPWSLLSGNEPLMRVWDLLYSAGVGVITYCTSWIRIVRSTAVVINDWNSAFNGRHQIYHARGTYIYIVFETDRTEIDYGTLAHCIFWYMFTKFDFIVTVRRDPLYSHFVHSPAYGYPLSLATSVQRLLALSFGRKWLYSWIVSIWSILI